MFGSHLSIAGGLHNALLEAEKFGFNSVQVFTKNCPFTSGGFAPRIKPAFGRYNQDMAATHPFLGIDDDLDLVLLWFQGTDLAIRHVDRDDAGILHFNELGPFVESADEEIDQGRSPIVWIVKPRLVRSSLWMSGEVVFAPTPLRGRFPDLQKANRRLSDWLKEFPVVYDNRKPEDFEWAYYLEGSIKNWDGVLFALPVAYDRLRRGQYFVHHRDDGDLLDRVCRQLRLRGVNVDG